MAASPLGQASRKTTRERAPQIADSESMVVREGPLQPQSVAVESLLLNLGGITWEYPRVLRRGGFLYIDRVGFDRRECAKEKQCLQKEKSLSF